MARMTFFRRMTVMLLSGVVVSCGSNSGKTNTTDRRTQDGDAEKEIDSSDKTPPTAPEGLVAEPAAFYVKLSWKAAQDPSGTLKSHSIYRDGQLVTSVDAGITSYTDAGLTPKTTYVYCVSAEDGGGNQSEKSNEVSVTTTGVGGADLYALHCADMLQLRGVNSGNPGHSGAQQLHFRPLGAIQTLSALSADLSDAPVPAVAATSFFRFGSRANKSAVLLTANNLLEELMVPLVLSGSTSAASRRNAMKNYMQAVRTSINRDLRASSDFFNGSIASQNAAFEMFSRSFGDLSKTRTQLLAKYDSLIKRAIDPSREVIGLNDKPIGVSGTRNSTYHHDGVRVTNEDLRTMFDAKTNIDSMARAFALAEFIARNDISYSVSIGIGGIQDLLMGTSRKNFNVDEHFTGSMVSLLISSYMARATSACLLAFIDVLKELNIFDDTVINISGEFNRKPRADGSGSDHNWEGANLNFYSGAITRPRVLGNIAANNDPNYPGTYGLGAPVTELGGIQLDLGHVAASVATLLRAPSPVTARTTLLEESSGVVTPLSSVPNGKIV